jgi:hypothetical protein
VHQVEVLAFDAPCRADAKIAELGGLVGGVPALHDAVEFLGPFVWRIASKPSSLDHAAAQWRRHLLVLAGEVVFADRATDLVEGRKRLALRMQCLTALPGK